MPAPHTGKIFELHQQCGFVEKLDDAGNREMMVIDKRASGTPKYYPLNETQGFILRCLIQRVDTAHLKQMYLSEFVDAAGQPVGDADADLDIRTVIDDFVKAGILKPGGHRRYPRKPAGLPMSHDFTGLPMDLSVGRNQWGLWIIKLPLV